MVAILLDSGADGEWASQQIQRSHVSAPSLMPFEAANIIRRSEQAGIVGSDSAAQAHADLLQYPVELWPYELLAERSWQLRHNMTSYDASYAALAELLKVPLITLDTRISRVPTLRCEVRVPR
jgi:predicted nucleic acid-binding protein